jgi:hypothetical protein
MDDAPGARSGGVGNVRASRLVPGGPEAGTVYRRGRAETTIARLEAVVLQERSDRLGDLLEGLLPDDQPVVGVGAEWLVLRP